MKNSKSFAYKMDAALQKLTPGLATALERVWDFKMSEKFSDNKIEAGLRLQPFEIIRAFFYLATLGSGKFLISDLCNSTEVGYLELKNALRSLDENEIISVKFGEPNPGRVDPNDVFIDTSPLQWKFKFPQDFNVSDFFPAIYAAMNSDENETMRKLLNIKNYNRSGDLVERGFRDQPFSTLAVAFCIAARGTGTFTFDELTSGACANHLAVRNAVAWLGKRQLIEAIYKTESVEINISALLKKFGLEINYQTEVTE